MLEHIRYEPDREAWLLEGEDLGSGYRLVVPRDFVEDELGGPSTTDQGEDWVRHHIPQILQAYTARTDGGWVKEPWNRVMVEMVD